MDTTASTFQFVDSPWDALLSACRDRDDTCLSRLEQGIDAAEAQPDLLRRLDTYRELSQGLSEHLLGLRWFGESSSSLSTPLHRTLSAWLKTIVSPHTPLERAAEDLTSILTLATAQPLLSASHALWEGALQDAGRALQERLRESDRFRIRERLLGALFRRFGEAWEGEWRDAVAAAEANPMEKSAPVASISEAKIIQLANCIPSLLWLQAMIEARYPAKADESPGQNKARDTMRTYLTAIHCYLRNGSAATTETAIERLAADFGTEAPRHFYRRLGEVFEYETPQGDKLGISDHVLSWIRSETIADPRIQLQIRLDLLKRFIRDDSLQRRADAVILTSLQCLEARARALSDREALAQLTRLHRLKPYWQASNRALDHLFSLEGFGIGLASMFVAGGMGEAAVIAASFRAGLLGASATLETTAALGALRFTANWAAFNASLTGLKTAVRLGKRESLPTLKEVRFQLVNSFFSLGLGHLAASPFANLAKELPAFHAARFFAFSAGMVQGENVAAAAQGLPPSHDPFSVRFYEASLNAAFLEMGAKAGRPISTHLLQNYAQKQLARRFAESASGAFARLVVPPRLSPVETIPERPVLPEGRALPEIRFAASRSSRPPEGPFDPPARLEANQAKLWSRELGWGDPEFQSEVEKHVSSLVEVDEATEAFMALEYDLAEQPEGLRRAVFLQIISGKINVDAALDIVVELRSGQISLELSSDGLNFIKIWEDLPLIQRLSQEIRDIVLKGNFGQRHRGRELAKRLDNFIGSEEFRSRPDVETVREVLGAITTLGEIDLVRETARLPWILSRLLATPSAVDLNQSGVFEALLTTLPAIFDAAGRPTPASQAFLKALVQMPGYDRASHGLSLKQAICQFYERHFEDLVGRRQVGGGGRANYEQEIRNEVSRLMAEIDGAGPSGEGGSGIPPGILAIGAGFATWLASTDALAATLGAQNTGGDGLITWLAAAGLIGMTWKGGKPPTDAKPVTSGEYVTKSTERRQLLEDALGNSRIELATRTQAAMRLGNHRDVRSAERLLAILTNPKEPMPLRYATMKALQNFAGTEINRVAMKIFRDRGEPISLRYQAMFKLLKEDDPLLPEVLAQMAGDMNETTEFRTFLIDELKVRLAKKTER